MKKLFLLYLSVLIFQALWADETGDTPQVVSPAQTALSAFEKQRLDTLRFGTDTEIASLIQLIRNEKVTYMDNELIDIAQKTKNKAILTGIFNFFGETEKNGLEERAIRVITDRDQEANDSVLAAVNYLGFVKADSAVDALEDLIITGENRFLGNTVRALGRVASEEKADSIADFLLDYYNDRSPNEEIKQEIISALGETGSKEGVSFLLALIEDPDEKGVLRMAALDAISKIGDEDSLEAIIEAVSSPDPNVRSSAVAALAPFSGEATENAILEAFRDSYYRTRIGAAQAAGKRRMESAVPYLRYRAENDDVPTVKDEAIKALGAINNDEAMSVLDSLFSERKNSDRVRIMAADMLLRNNAEVYGSRVFAEMEDAKLKNQTPLYNGFIRIMGTAKAASMENIAQRLIQGGGVIEKSLALDLILNNEFRQMADVIRSLLDDKKHSASIARKAQSTLEKLGL
jgi:HEAT repeat protein